MITNNLIQNIALVGFSGRVGKYLTKALLDTKQFNITVLTRAESAASSSPPEGTATVVVDYSSPSSLVSALKGKDVLLVTMSPIAPASSSVALMEAAAEAGVPWVFPSEWGSDYFNEEISRDIMLGAGVHAIRRLIESKGVSKWLSVASGFWYEHSLSLGEAFFGFNFQERSVTFFGDGNVKLSVSTWDQVARATAAVLTLPVYPEDGREDQLTVSSFANNIIYMSSFYLSQKDMFESVLRVTGTKESDWTVKYESAEERYKDGQKELKAGNRLGFAKLLYSRYYFQDENTQQARILRKSHNKELGLPEEDLDEATKRAVDIANQMAAGGH